MTAIVLDLGDMRRYGNHVDSESPAFTDIDGQDANPDQVILSAKLPDGTFLEYAWPVAGASGLLIQEATGRFYADILHDQYGIWSFRLEGTGEIKAAAEFYVYVRRSLVA